VGFGEIVVTGPAHTANSVEGKIVDDNCPDTTNDFAELGLISETEKGSLVCEAAHCGCGAKQ
jgi:hypothetical protein